MNIPEPCNTCKNLYEDLVMEDKPLNVSKCELNLEIGNKKCKKFEHYRSQENNDKSFGDILREYI